MTTVTQIKPNLRAAFTLEELRAFVEHESDLLDEQRFEEWYHLFAEDGAYWVPAQHGQLSWLNHVSLFYDEKPVLKTRVARLNHPMIHCQDPESRCVRMVSNFSIEEQGENECRVRSKFIMFEDRQATERRLFGGRYVHTLRRTDEGLKIVLKRVEITNCDQSFPMLTQPF
jgi:benzoate/toluate 1,2-dioxygenase beta subunit